jgi:thiol-disulfide isomerase/thioredoxin
MWPRFVLTASLLLLGSTGYARNVTVKPGQPAPEIKVAEWMKGKPFQAYSDSQLTVVEFWGTWCPPCVRMIPHITALAKKHQGKVAFYGIDVWEQAGTDSAHVKKFVADMGAKMDYNVARDTADEYMGKNWMAAAGQTGVPLAFVVDKKGVVLFIGEPAELDGVIEKALAGNFDLKASLKSFEAGLQAAAAEAAKPLEEQQRREDADALSAAVRNQVNEAVELYKAGKKSEALANIAAIDDHGDFSCKVMKRQGKVQMLYSDIKALTAFTELMIKEGGAVNSQVLIAMPSFYRVGQSSQHRALVLHALQKGFEMDAENPLACLNAGESYLGLGDKKKALAAAEAGLKRLRELNDPKKVALESLLLQVKEQAGG